MRKLIFILFAIIMTSCSSPMERSQTASEFGEVLWRSHPSSSNKAEMFLCVDEHGALWVVRVSEDGETLKSANKINGYKAKPSL